MNATQIQSQGPSVNTAEFCSRFEEEEQCHSELSLDCLKLGRDRHQRASKCSQILSFQSSQLSRTITISSTAKSWLDLGLMLQMSSNRKSPSGASLYLKDKTPKVLGSVPMLGQKEREVHQLLCPLKTLHCRKVKLPRPRQERTGGFRCK